MLELQNLSRSFRGIPAIQNVSFTLASGEIVGFQGTEWCWQIDHRQDHYGNAPAKRWQGTL